MCTSDYMQTTFFYHGRFLKKIADDQCPSTTKGSMKHLSKQPFTMEVYTFNICTYCVFTLYDRTLIMLVVSGLWAGYFVLPLPAFWSVGGVFKSKSQGTSIVLDWLLIIQIISILFAKWKLSIIIYLHCGMLHILLWMGVASHCDTLPCCHGW